jgi:hypothetical protein
MSRDDFTIEGGFEGRTFRADRDPIRETGDYKQGTGLGDKNGLLRRGCMLLIRPLAFHQDYFC